MIERSIPRVDLTHYRPAMPFANREISFRGFVQFSIVTILKNHPLGNLKSNYLGIFQSFKLCILMDKNRFNLSLKFKLNFKYLGLGLR